MVCKGCCRPCLGCLQRRLAPASGEWWCCLILTEVIRWLVIVTPIYLSVWRYATLRGYTVFIPGSTDVMAQYWGVVTGFVLAGTVLLYLPVKVIGIMYRVKHGLMTGMTWRPSVLIYVLLGALPCLVIILIAAKTDGQEANVMDGVTITVLQTSVLGLTFTEWMSKLRDEQMTYDLITAMADDFFFAYDVIEFITMCTKEEKIYHSNWCYVCFAFAFVAMFKYLPAQPVNLEGRKAPKNMATGIIVSLFTCDIPFVVIRITTIALFGFEVSELIYPIKNVALIIFGCAQLYMIWKTVKEREQKKDKPHLRHVPTFPQRRVSRHPECWADEDGTIWCERRDTQGNKKVTKHPEAYSDAEGNVWFEVSGLGESNQVGPLDEAKEASEDKKRLAKSQNSTNTGTDNQACDL